MRRPIRLFLLDFDNTLVTSDSCVRVLNESGKEIERFKDDTFRNYQFQVGEYLDFSHMESLEILNKTAELTPLGHAIKYSIANPPRDFVTEYYVVLTSRATASVVNQYLLNVGIPVDRVIAVNSSEWYTQYSNKNNAEKKSIATKLLIDELDLNSNDQIIYYDDDQANLEAVRGVYPDIIKTIIARI